jgi:formate hydrogenlyase subunit 3/multisubunit Na+/H+ antiporter MnhD subunit
MIPWMLSGLLAFLALLSALGAAGRGRAVQGGVALASASFVLLGLAALWQGGTVPVLLPFGPPWAPLSLGPDGLSAWFLMLLGLAGLPAALAGWAAADQSPRRLMLWPLLLAGLALALGAADAFGLLLGFALAALAAHALLSAEGAWTASAGLARADLLATLLSVTALAVAVGLLTGLSGDLSFAGLRAAPPEGGQAAAILLLVLPAAAARAALPLLAPLPPGPSLLLVGGAMPPVAIYLLARLLLDLGGPAQPLWWGAPLLAGGALLALAGALRALRQAELSPLLGGVALAHLGLVAAGLGLSAALRAADLAPLAAVAAGAALLHLPAQALFLALLWLAAGEIAHGAGARHLDRLGGLVHVMPVLAWVSLAGAAAAALLPPFAGFAGGWLLLQALFSAWRAGPLAFQLLTAAAVALLGLAMASLASALLRFWGLCFLGRPRTPRTLGAAEVAPLPRALLLALLALSTLLGLLPGLPLRLTEPALLLLAGHGGAAELGGLSTSAGPLAADYLPLGLGLLLALLLALAAGAMRQASPHPAVAVPPWDDGFIAPPPHLPFGDPATQPDAAGLATPMRPLLPRWPGLPAMPHLPWRPRWRLRPGRRGTARRALRFGLGSVVVLLLLLAWLGGGA